MSVPIRVREATFQDYAAWDAYLRTHPGACSYQLAGWQDVFGQRMGHRTVYLMATQSGRVAGVLPMVLVRSRTFGSILCSLPFLNYGGPCADTAAVSQCLVDEAVKKSNHIAADYLELRCAAPLDIDLPSSLHKVSLTVRLDADPETIWLAFSSKHRNNIRRVQRQDLDVISGGSELLPKFYCVMEQSWRSLGTPLYSMEFFQDVLNRFAESTTIFVCRQAGIPVAVAFNGYFNGTVEGMWAGMTNRGRSLQANYVLYWEMIRDACERGYRKFHLGRSTAESSGEQFKRKWNGEVQQLHWYYYCPRGGPIPALSVDNPRYRLAIAAWRRLPLWVVRRLGPPLARCIP